MNGEIVSAALSGLPEDMVEEAMTPARKSWMVPWLRVAACFAVVVALVAGTFPRSDEIVTAPGILTLTVYAKCDNGSGGYVMTQLQSGIEPIRRQEPECVMDGIPVDPPGVSVYFSMEFQDFPAEQIEYDIQVDYGVYSDWSNGDYVKMLHKSFTRSNNTWCVWDPYFAGEKEGYHAAFNSDKYDHVYTRIIIRCEDNIIGYAVIRFDRLYDENGPRTFFDPYLVSSVVFPKQNGEYQNISYEYVEDCILKCKP